MLKPAAGRHARRARSLAEIERGVGLLAATRAAVDADAALTRLRRRVRGALRGRARCRWSRCSTRRRASASASAARRRGVAAARRPRLPGGAGRRAALAGAARAATCSRRLDRGAAPRRAEIELDDARPRRCWRADDPPPLPDAFGVIATVAAGSPAARRSRRLPRAAWPAQRPVGRAPARPLLPRRRRARRAGRASTCAPRRRCDPTRCSPRSCTCPRAASATSSRGRCCAATRSRSSGARGAPRERQIPLDRPAGHASTATAIVLRSRRLGREVVPRLTTAHNFALAQPRRSTASCARCSTQGMPSGCSWSWGPLDDAPFLPRVRQRPGSCSRARAGRSAASELEPTAGAARGADASTAAVAARCARERGLPRWVAAGRRRQRAARRPRQRAVASTRSLDLVEQPRRGRAGRAVPAARRAAASRGPEGRFSHELVVPFVRRARRGAPRPAAPAAAAAGAGDAHASRPARSGCTPSSTPAPRPPTRVLREVVAPLVARRVATRRRRRWFFIRYGDPRLAPARALPRRPGAAARRASCRARRGARAAARRRPALAAPARHLRARGRALRRRRRHRARRARSSTPTARRCWRSSSCWSGDAGADARWRLALRGIDALLADLGLDIAGAARPHEGACARRSGASSAPTRDSPGSSASSSRAERTSLEELLDGRATTTRSRPARALRRRSERSRPCRRAARARRARAR